MTGLKRSWIILIAILVLELIPFTLLLARSPAGVLGRLYGFDAAPLGSWLAAFVIAAGYATYAARSFPLLGQNFLRLNTMKLVAIVFAIVTGTVEEVYFRKLLMDWAAHRAVAALGQVAISAIMFGVAHGVWGVFARQWRMAVGAAAATGMLGALLGLVYLWAGRHVAPCVWAHMLINLVIEPWLIISAASANSRWSPPPRAFRKT